MKSLQLTDTTDPAGFEHGAAAGPAPQAQETASAADAFFELAFGRNVGLLNRAELLRLRHARIGIPGLGGVGGSHLIALARSGVGAFNVADFDTFELANLNRQYGAKTSTLGRAKLEVMVAEAKDVNPFLSIKEFAGGVQLHDVDAFLAGIDLLIDGLDFFALDVRRVVFKRARELGIPAITVGPLGYTAAMLYFDPNRGMTFDEYFAFDSAEGPSSASIRFALGLAPKLTHLQHFAPGSVNHRAQCGPSLGLTCGVCSSIACAEAIKILLNRKPPKPVPHTYQFDLFNRRTYLHNWPGGNRFCTQRFKLREFVRRQAQTARRPQMPELPLPSAFGQTVSAQQMTFLLRAAIQAPSGDNVQPWGFNLESDSIQVLLRPQADPSLFNHRQRASLLSCGAAIENIAVAARGLGLDTDISVVGDLRSNLMARVALRQGASASPEHQQYAQKLCNAVWNRHTNRTMYLDRPWYGDSEDSLQQQLQDLPDTRLRICTDRSAIRDLWRQHLRVEQILSERRDLHEYFQSMIRYSTAETELTRDGFPLNNLEAGRGGNLFLRATRYWPVMQLLNRVGVGKIKAHVAARGLLHCSGIGVIYARDIAPRSLVEAGRAFQRVWLGMTHLGYAVQPFAAMPLLSLLLEDEQGAALLTSAQQQTLRKVSSYLRETLAERQGDVPVMIFRCGVAKRGPLAYTLRKDLDSFLECLAESRTDSEDSSDQTLTIS